MHGREPKSLHCGLEWMLEMMWGACLTGRYNCTLPRPPLHSQAVAGLRSRGRKNAWPSTGVLVVGLPVWFQSGPMQEGKSNTLRISSGPKRDWERHLEKSVWVKDQRSKIRAFGWSQQLGQMANRWNVGFGETKLSDEWLSGSTSVGPRQLFVYTVYGDQSRNGSTWNFLPGTTEICRGYWLTKVHEDSRLASC